jgi:Lon protease-like protein
MPSEFVSVINPTVSKGAEDGGRGRSYPVLPVRDTVLFPHAVLPLTVGRESSIQLIQSLGEEKTILVVAQRDARQDLPEGSDLYAIGTRATVHKVVKMPNQSLFVFTEGTERVKLGNFTQTTPFLTAEFETVEEVAQESSPETEAMQRNVIAQFQEIVTSSSTLSDDLQTIALNIEDPSRLADFIAASLPFLTTVEKQELLEMPDVRQRVEKINSHLAKELEVQQLRNKIQSEVQDSVQQSQRDFYLRDPEGRRRTEGEDRGGGDAGRREEGFAEGAGAAGTDESGGGRLLADAKLRGVAGGAAVGEELRRRGGHQEGAGGAGRRPLWAEEGEGPHSGLSERAPAEAGYEGADPVLRRASGRGQDEPGAEHCASAGAEVQPHLAGRHA